ncbi:cell envelope integrity protein TolA [Marinobacterium sp. YM272]|uniref:cell envelope integrity protein TolA n=1 Tax=Marinobacterium sp. YM272 TaxID=3421654 RepID=UPI003D7F3676
MELRGYILPTILATLLHVVILGGLLTHWVGTAEPERRTPRHIQAKMIDLEALTRDAGQSSAPPEQADPQAQQQAEAKQRQAEETRRKAAEAERQAQEKARAEVQRQKQLAAKQEAEKAAAEKKKAELAARKKAEALAKQKAAEEAKRQEQARRQAEEKAQQEAAARAKAEAQAQARAEAAAKQRAEEAAAQARAEQARQAAQRAQAVVGDITSYIHGLLQRNWRIPATARNGMEAVVSIRLLGNGEIDQASIVESSGDAAFDRSALQAVYRTERFERVAEVDPIVFERRLRSIRVVFRPEGLRY